MKWTSLIRGILNRYADGNPELGNIPSVETLYDEPKSYDMVKRKSRLQTHYCGSENYSSKEICSFGFDGSNPSPSTTFKVVS